MRVMFWVPIERMCTECSKHLSRVCTALCLSIRRLCLPRMMPLTQNGRRRFTAGPSPTPPASFPSESGCHRGQERAGRGRGRLKKAEESVGLRQSPRKDEGTTRAQTGHESSTSKPQSTQAPQKDRKYLHIFSSSLSYSGDVCQRVSSVVSKGGGSKMFGKGESHAKLHPVLH